jgi:hypothetical protein
LHGQENLSVSARNHPSKLPAFGAGAIAARQPGELHHVIWLTLMWLGLIALWGASEAWDLALIRRVVARVAQVLRRHERAHPFDWADRGSPGPRPAAGRW